jgi:hypothetical protein
MSARARQGGGRQDVQPDRIAVILLGATAAIVAAIQRSGPDESDKEQGHVGGDVHFLSPAKRLLHLDVAGVASEHPLKLLPR